MKKWLQGILILSFLTKLEPFNSIKCSLPFFLQACLDDFTHHNIDVACNLLETCGRFLYRSPETTLRMTNMLDILMRLKNVKNLDPRQSTLVENAYYLCKPPERSARISKVRPPLHQVFTNLHSNYVVHYVSYNILLLNSIDNFRFSYTSIQIPAVYSKIAVFGSW